MSAHDRLMREIMTSLNDRCLRRRDELTSALIGKPIAISFRGPEEAARNSVVIGRMTSFKWKDGKLTVYVDACPLKRLTCRQVIDREWQWDAHGSSTDEIYPNAIVERL